MAMTWVTHSCQGKTAAREAEALLEIFLLFNHWHLKFEEKNGGRTFIITPLSFRPVQSAEQFTAKGMFQDY